MKDCFLTECVASKNPLASQASPPNLPFAAELVPPTPGTEISLCFSPKGENTWITPSAAKYSPVGATATAERSLNLRFSFTGWWSFFLRPSGPGIVRFSSPSVEKTRSAPRPLSATRMSPVAESSATSMGSRKSSWVNELTVEPSRAEISATVLVRQLMTTRVSLSGGPAQMPVALRPSRHSFVKCPSKSRLRVSFLMRELPVSTT